MSDPIAVPISCNVCYHNVVRIAAGHQIQYGGCFNDRSGQMVIDDLQRENIDLARVKRVGLVWRVKRYGQRVQLVRRSEGAKNGERGIYVTMESARTLVLPPNTRHTIGVVLKVIDSVLLCDEMNCCWSLWARANKFNTLEGFINITVKLQWAIPILWEDGKQSGSVPYY